MTRAVVLIVLSLSLVFSEDTTLIQDDIDVQLVDESITKSFDSYQETTINTEVEDYVTTVRNYVTKNRIKPPNDENIQNRTNESFSTIVYNDINSNPTLQHFSLLNSSNDERKLSENYGISAVLSGDIFSLKSVVDGMPNSKCKNDSLLMFQGILNGQQWALKMYDASAKSAVGLLAGATFQLGNFDECLEHNEVFENQYCLAHVQYKKAYPTKNVTKRLGPRDDIHWAACVPASCSAKEVENFFSSLLLRSSNYANISITDNYCHKQSGGKPLEAKDILFIVFISVFAAILVLSTAYHLYLIKKHNHEESQESVKMSALLAFSVVRNFNKIFTVKQQQNDLGLDAISGLKAISMIFIIVGHALIFIVSGPVMNTNFYDDMLPRLENAPMLGNPLLVDTFLFISAFLFCRLLLTELDKRNGRVNVIPIYIFRYIRITASYAVVIAFYSTIINRFGDGPLWDHMLEIEKTRCHKSWWANILYINNYVNTDNLCMFQSWYLSVDTQLFFVAPLIIYPLWKWRRVGEWLLVLSTIITTAIPFIITYINEYDPILMPFIKEVGDISQNDYFKNAYMKTHMKANTYCLGIAFGYILYRIQTSDFKFAGKKLFISWLIGDACSIIPVFVLTIFYQPDYQYNSLSAALYSSLHHIAWAIANGWLLISCATNNGGFTGKIFTWKPWIPLSRLTYCAYLVNGIIELQAIGSLRHSVHLSIYRLTVTTFAHVVQTFIAALFLCLMFESPIHRIEKILLGAVGKKSGESNQNLTDDKNRTVNVEK